jgi:hypothetical protein
MTGALFMRPQKPSYLNRRPSHTGLWVMARIIKASSDLPATKPLTRELSGQREDLLLALVGHQLLPPATQRGAPSRQLSVPLASRRRYPPTTKRGGWWPKWCRRQRSPQ